MLHEQTATDLANFYDDGNTNLLPKTINLLKNGNKLVFEYSTLQKNAGVYQIIYTRTDHFKDGEPDVLEFDVSPISKNGGNLGLSVSITYGDHEIYLFGITHGGKVDLGVQSAKFSRADRTPDRIYFDSRDVGTLKSYFSKICNSRQMLGTDLSFLTGSD